MIQHPSIEHIEMAGSRTAVIKGTQGSGRKPAADVKGLLLAGRCISGDFLAHSSYRVTGNSVACGQAAGAAAALAAKGGKLPQDVPFSEIKQAMEKQPETQPAI